MYAGAYDLLGVKYTPPGHFRGIPSAAINIKVDPKEVLGRC